MDIAVLYTFIALTGLFSIHRLYVAAVNAYSERQILSIFYRKSNHYLYSQFMIENGRTDERVARLTKKLLDDFMSCIERNRDSMVTNFHSNGRIELDGYSLLHLDGQDYQVQEALKIINYLFYRSFHVKVRGGDKIQQRIEFSIDEYKQKEVRRSSLSMLEEEERMEILQTELLNVPRFCVVRVRMGVSNK